MEAPELYAPEIYVQPGELHLVHNPTVLKTVLGSCVGVTFRIPRLGIGAICHPMLPRCPPARAAHSRDCANGRYVDFAIRELARQLDALGAERIEAEVKLFGGADVLPAHGKSLRPTVGKLNSEMALRVLREEGFDVQVSRLGGSNGIHIQFDTGTGEVLLRHLK